MRDTASVGRIARKGAVLCMVLGPLSLLLAAAIHPPIHGNEVDQFAAAVDHPTAWMISHAFNVAGLLLQLGTVVALGYILRRREPGLALLGPVLAVMGIAATIGYSALHGYLSYVAIDSGPQATMAKLMEDVFASPAVIVPFLLIPSVTGAGVACLAFGLYRARVAPAWVAGLIAVSVPIGGLGATPALASNQLFIAGPALLVVPLAWLAHRVLGWSQAEWEHAPEFGRRVMTTSRAA